MKRAFVYCLACGIGLMFAVGCGDETKATKKETISTPNGKTTTTDEHKVNTSGNAPPAKP